MINRRQLGITLFAIGAIFFGCGVWLSIYFARVRPVEPNLSIGFTHQLGNHGKFVYLTSGEYWLHHGCFIVAAVLLVLAVSLDRARR
jgi:hypothetical protein